MSGKAIYEMHAEMLKALAHPLRIEVIDLIEKEELCFSDILEQTGGLKSNLSQHLSIMVSNGILKVRKDSRCNYYRLSSAKVAKACDMLKDLLKENIKRQNKLLQSQ
jgi:DNA-binding transcriptional ArsR family regulator